MANFRKHLSWAGPILLVAVITTAIWSVSRATTSHPITITSARLSSLFEQAHALPSNGDRVAFWSQKLLAEPSLLSPLGSGPAVNDTAPIFPRHFDCTTFIETVGGLALSGGVEEIADRIISLRYDHGQVGYGTRNHFPEADWIPNNTAAGNISDITLRVARDSNLVAAFANKDIDKSSWFEEQGRTIASGASEQTPIAVSLPYIPLEQFVQAAAQVPSGSVVNIVRADSEVHPVLISHQTVLVHEGGESYLIHVSLNKRISRIKVSDYVASMGHQRWPVLGFNVNML